MRDIFQLIKKEHDEVKGTLQKITGGIGEGSINDLFSELQHELGTHMRLEEKFFYPALVDEEGLHEMVLKSIEEHNVVKKLFREFGSLAAGDDKWMAKMQVMDEVVRLHIKEEEGPIFRKAKSVIDRNKSQEIAGKWEKEKEKIMAGAR